MTPIVPRLEKASESISSPDRHGRMAKIICPKCSQVVDSTTSPSQCPGCGHTFPVADDSTRSRFRAPSTIIAPPTDELPRQIGRYLILRELGKGGFGIVYLARDPRLDQLVAIKIPRADTGMHPTALRRFEGEGRNAARLKRDGIVRVLTVEYEGVVPFIVSEYVEGITLTDRLKDGPPFEFRDSAELVKTLAAAIEYAHSQDVIHRDVKPSNILIATDGKPWLMDFGLAMRESLDESIAMPTHIIGTPGYMSPEQAAGKQKVDRRTDIYSLGVVLYQLLTREVPFRGEMRMVLRQVIEEDPRNPRSLNADIPLDLETICETAMRKEVKSRYQTAGELAEELDCYLENKPIKARPITRLERAWRWSRRHPARAGLIASVVLLLALSTGGAFGFAAVADKGRKEAVGRQLAEANARESAEESRDKEAALRKVEAEARKEAEASERRINEALQRNQELLSRAYVERGERYIRAPESTDEYNPMKSLPWFLEAMKIDEKHPNRLLDDRIRIQTALDSIPWTERMWFAKGIVQAAALSPKRDTFCVAGGGTVSIWPTQKGSAPVTLVHPGWVLAVAFSPDGTRLGTGCVDGIRIWSTASGACLKGPLDFSGTTATQRASGYQITAIAFSRSGRLLFASATHGVGQIWNSETGEAVGGTIPTLMLQPGAAFTSSDRLLVVPSNRAIRVYDAQTAKQSTSWQSLLQHKTGVTLSPDGKTVAAYGDSGGVVLWNAETGETIGKPLPPSDEPEVRLTAVALSKSGDLIATGTPNGTVRIWNVRTGELRWRERAFPMVVDHLQFSPDDSFLTAASLEKKLCTFAVKSGHLAAEPVNFVSRQHSVDWTGAPEKILTVGIDGVARLWSLKSRLATCRLASVREAAVSADRRTLATVDEKGEVSLFRSSPDGRFDPENSQTIPTGEQALDAISLSRDGSRIALSSQRRVTVWDTKTHKPVAGPWLHGDWVSLMRFTPNADCLICITHGGSAAVWNLPTGNQLYEPINVGRHPLDIDFDSAAKRCAVAATNGVTVWDLETGDRLRPGFLGDRAPCFTRFANDPDRLLIGRGKELQLWDLRTARQIHTLASPSRLRCVDVLTANARFLTGDDGGTARIWRCTDGAPASLPFEHPSAVCGGTIDPKGRFVLTFTDDSRACLWNALSGEIVSALNRPVLEVGSASAKNDDTPQTLRIRLAFFSPAGTYIHILAEPNTLVSIGLNADHRFSKQIADDVTIRTGAEFDSLGGLRALEPRELAVRWKAYGRAVAASGTTHVESFFPSTCAVRKKVN